MVKGLPNSRQYILQSGEIRFEVLPQSCNIAYMNRFNDWLSLPSDGEAIKVYQGTYSERFEELRKAKY